jgi:DNA-binding transcriptional LysR family regulator
VPLLARSGRRVVLTPAGVRLVGHAEVVLERLEMAAAELAGSREGLSGPVRLGTFPTATHALVPAALRLLGGRHPGLEPMVSEIDPVDVAQAVRAGEVEVALVQAYDFVPGPVEPGVDSAALCAERMFLAHRGELAHRGGAAGLRAAAGEPWIVATPGTLCREMAVRACRAAGFVPRVRHQVDDFGTVLALVAAGQGVALVPELGVGGAPPAGVVLAPVPFERLTRVAYRSGAGGHPAVAALVSALRDAVSELEGAASQLGGTVSEPAGTVSQPGDRAERVEEGGFGD